MISTQSDSEEEQDLNEKDYFTQIRNEALAALEEEPELCSLLHRTVLAPGVKTFEDAVAYTVCHRMIQQTPGDFNGPNKGGGDYGPVFCPDSLRSILSDAMYSEDCLEAGHTMSKAVRRDAWAVLKRDPACKTLLEVVLFYKGFAALVCHRAARQKWMQAQQKRKKRSMTALFLQSQASAVFGVDIHPATSIGAGVMFDHGTGIVVGETATIGDGCTLLHGVTLGGTGKQSGDRHPKVGRNVLIGAGASILGNVRVGKGCKIGAGSIVLRDIPDGATAVGAPAKIIGRAIEAKPGSFMDDTLQTVALLHKSESSDTLATAAETASTTSSKSSFIRSTSTNYDKDKKNDIVFRSDDSEGDSSSLEPVDEEGTVLCPYRDYRKVRAPSQEAITYCTLGKWMKGCTPYEIGSVFFALDTRNVGYVYWDEFQKRAPAVLQKYVTSIDSERVQGLLNEAAAQIKKNNLSSSPPPSLANGDGEAAELSHCEGCGSSSSSTMVVTAEKGSAESTMAPPTPSPISA